MVRPVPTPACDRFQAGVPVRVTVSPETTPVRVGPVANVTFAVSSVVPS